VDTFIGLLELVFWIVAVAGLAAGVTYAVIKLFPAKDESAPTTGEKTTASR
jgi:hypothetical protein